MHKLNKDQVVQSLQWRAHNDTLAAETAVLEVMHNTMTEPGSKYGKAQFNAVANVLGWSKIVLGHTPLATLTPIQTKQARIYAMFGPGWAFLPRSAICQPADFYFDTRTGPAKFPKRTIEREVSELAAMVKADGGDPHCVPDLPAVHNCGIW